MGSRILLVEDDDDIRNLVAARLQHAGHRVAGTRTGEEALQLVDERGAPEIAVLDVGLPGADGFEVLEALRERAPGLPAVFLSAFVQDSSVAQGRALGATYLTKPFVTSALLAAIDKAVPAGAGTW